MTPQIGKINIILAMREKWLKLILRGEKTAEVRRTRPSGDVLNCDDSFYITLYFYSQGRIHGMAHANGFACLEYFRREQMGDWCRKACLTPAQMDKYLDGAAHPIVYEIDSVERFDTPFHVPCRPQSWQYATGELLETIKRQMMNQDKLRTFRNRWNGEAAERLRMMCKTVTSALQKLETPLGHRAMWLRSLLEGNACDPCGKMYLLKLIGDDLAEDIGQLEPLEEDQIGAYDREVEIMQDAIQEANDFINKFSDAERNL